jgi:hypothetical protein
MTISAMCRVCKSWFVLYCLINMGVTVLKCGRVRIDHVSSVVLL